MTPGILFSQMEPPHELEAEFHRWYDEEHIPARLSLAGFVSATRYEAVEGSPRYLAVYELSDLAALDSSEYLALKKDPSPATRAMLEAVHGFTRFSCAEVARHGEGDFAGEYLYVVAFNVPAAFDERFEDFYEHEHCEALLKGEHWRRIRRYAVREGFGGDWTAMALHDLSSLEALRSDARAAARAAPKRLALSTEPWFEDSGRWIYRRIAGGGS